MAYIKFDIIVKSGKNDSGSRSFSARVSCAGLLLLRLE